MGSSFFQKSVFLFINWVLFFSTVAQGKPTASLWTFYGNEVSYELFSSVYLPSEADELNQSASLNDPIDNQIVADYEKNELKQIQKELTALFDAKLKLPSAKWSTLSPYQAVYKSIELSTKVFTYEKTDDKETGEVKPLLDHIRCGKGDCDKYVAVSALAFLTLKQKSKSLSAYHLLPGCPRENNATNHDFNTLVVLGKDKLYISYLDPTSWDHGKDLIVAADSFFATTGDFFKFQAYALLANSAGTIFYGKKLLSSPNLEPKSYVYGHIMDALSASLKTINDEDNKELANDIYQAVLYFDLDNPKPSTPEDFARHGDGMLYNLYFYYYALETLHGDGNTPLSDRVNKPVAWLRKHFPNSPYAKIFNEG